MSYTYIVNDVSYTYTIPTSGTTGTATLERFPAYRPGFLNILETFVVNGVTYTVTSIGAYALYENYITGLAIPSTVRNIGAWAMGNVSTLKKVYFRGTILPSYGFQSLNVSSPSVGYFITGTNISSVSSKFQTIVYLSPSEMDIAINANILPSAPIVLSVNANSPTIFNPTVSISFTQSPADSTITNYSYSTDGTNFIALSPAQTSSTLTIPATGLTSGSSYTFSIKAINIVGSSSASTGVSSTFYMPPVAPTITSVNGLSINFTQSPADSTITNYSYTIDGTNYTALSPAQTSSPLTIPTTGLKFGSLYTYRIKAINIAGSSSTSNGIAKAMATIIPCFKDDTKILTKNGYVQIKDLINGDLVETFGHGLKPITVIGKKEVIHLASPDRNPEQLYKYTNTTHSSIFEDLVITGRHAILVDDFVSDEQRDNVSNFYKGVLKTDGKYLLPSSLDETATVYETVGKYTVYHLALQNDDENKNYGIYANGLLVETASEDYLKNRSKMELIE